RLPRPARILAAQTIALRRKAKALPQHRSGHPFGSAPHVVDPGTRPGSMDCQHSSVRAEGKKVDTARPAGEPGAEWPGAGFPEVDIPALIPCCEYATIRRDRY